MSVETEDIQEKTRLILPPPNSLTLGEIQNTLVYIEEKQAPEEEARIIQNFTDQKGLLFRWIRIPTKYFERYASSKSIENNTNFNIDDNTASILNYNIIELFTKCSKQLQLLWNYALPFNDKILSNQLLFKYNPSITQQIHESIGDYSVNSRARNINNIIKFEYHPLHKKVMIAFKNGIVFFDMKRNCWSPHVLQNENQFDITDFAVSECGMHLCVTCDKGIFVWNLREKKGELISESHTKYDRIIYSPCLKYIAAYAIDERFVEIYNVYSNKMVYRHSIYYRIKEMQWIPSTNANKFCPLRLLFVTDSSYLFLLNMVSFKAESFQCKVSNDADGNNADHNKVTQVSVSQNGNGIIAVIANTNLYYISMKQFSEPQHLVDLCAQLQRYKVYKIKWCPSDRRIAIIYKDSTNDNEIAPFVSIWAYDFSTSYHLGYITNPQNDTFPIDIAFRNHFNSGALLAICWNNAIISQHHLCFNR